MLTLQSNWMALLMMAFFWGIKHGLDADHLATIDGIARFNYKTNPHLSRRAGLYFSIGHGFVVILIALFVGVAARKWIVPDWLDQFGSLISIIFLMAIGIANLYSLLIAPRDQIVMPIGIKGRFLSRFTNTSHPLLVMCVGALFALSFDTISQAALFSIMASTLLGWKFSIIIGLMSILGMILIDTLNGLWVAHILTRAGRAAIIASRVMGLTIACISLSVGILGVARYFSTNIKLYVDGHELIFGFMIILIITTSYMLSLRFSSFSSKQRKYN